ncbi:ATP-binding protein, partial [Chloroflexus sp.]|uniref:ATP-binding protein n=1 Tax=Chloroflexus sp. TaxID=1904827 RepID=UPI00298EFB93
MYLFFFFRLPVWLLEALWMAGLRLAVISGLPVRHALAIVPPRFDQVIRLPLPGLKGLITLPIRRPTVARANSRAAEQAAIDLALYLAKSTMMKGTAQRTMATLAVAMLQRCQTLAEVAQAAERLKWLPSPLPKTIHPLLNELIEVSQDIRAANAATSAYAGSELLRQTLQRLSDMQSRVASVTNRADRRALGAIITRWQRLVQSRRQELATQALAERKIPPVFVTNRPLDSQTSSLFVGRQDILRRIEELALAAQPSALLLYGERYIGKTSTINMLPFRLPSDLVPLKVAVQEIAPTTTATGFITELIAQICAAAQKLPAATRLALPEPDPNAIVNDPLSALSRWMERAEQLAGQRRLLLCLDDYEQLHELPVEHQTHILSSLRSTIQQRPQWIVLFSGRRTIPELEPDWSEYLTNVTPIRLGVLAPADAEQLLRRPIPDFPEI